MDEGLGGLDWMEVMMLDRFLGSDLEEDSGWLPDWVVGT